MRAIVLCLVVLVGSHVPVHAQGSISFDPVVFLSTVNINQFYGEGNIRLPDGTHAVLVDTVTSNDMTLGFSMMIEADTLSTWRLWLDFDADRYYRPILVRVFAQRAVQADESEAFANLCTWVHSVQEKNLGAMQKEDAGFCRWMWTRRTDYYLTARSISTKDGEWLTLDLARGASEK